ncbi:unnamed protein product [Rhizopus stolonifer]
MVRNYLLNNRKAFTALRNYWASQESRLNATAQRTDEVANIPNDENMVTPLAPSDNEGIALIIQETGNAVNRPREEDHVVPLGNVEQGARCRELEPNVILPFFVTLEELYHGIQKPVVVMIRRYNQTTGGYLPAIKVVTIHVRPGWRSGTRIIVEDEGAELGAGRHQNLVFVLQEHPHQRFRREGNNLRITVNLTMNEALKGFRKEIKTLDGRSLWIQNTNPIDSYNQEHRISHEGMVNFENGARGDLIIIYEIDYPALKGTN